MEKILLLFQKLCQKFEQFRTETFWRTCSTSWTWPLNLTFWPFLTVFDPFWPFENMKNNYNDTTHRISGQNCTEPPATSYIQKNIDKCFHPEQLAWPVYLVLTVILCKSIKWGRIFLYLYQLFPMKNIYIFYMHVTVSPVLSTRGCSSMFNLHPYVEDHES